MVEYAKYGGFYKLCFEQASLNHEDRFLGENDVAFAYGVYAARKLKIFEQSQKLFVENTQRAQIIYVFLREFQIVDIVDDLFKTARYGIVVVYAAVEHVEHRHFIHLPRLAVTVEHCQLVKVGQ